MSISKVGFRHICSNIMPRPGLKLSWALSLGLEINGWPKLYKAIVVAENWRPLLLSHPPFHTHTHTVIPPLIKQNISRVCCESKRRNGDGCVKARRTAISRQPRPCLFSQIFSPHSPRVIINEIWSFLFVPIHYCFWLIRIYFYRFVVVVIIMDCTIEMNRLKIESLC